MALANNLGGNLNTYIDRIFRKDGGFTSYLGTAPAPWEAGSNYHLYRISDAFNDQADMYVRISDLNVVWIHNFISKVVSHIPKGLEPASFADSDFVIKECGATLLTSVSEMSAPKFMITGLKDLFEKVSAPVSNFQ